MILQVGKEGAVLPGVGLDLHDGLWRREQRQSTFPVSLSPLITSFFFFKILTIVYNNLLLVSIFSGSCELVVKKHNSFTSPQSCLPEGPLSYRSGLCPVCWAFLPVTDLSPSIIVLSPLPVKPIISARKSDSLQCQKDKKENLYFTVVRFKIVPECLGSDLLRIAGHLRRNPQGLCFFFFF